MTTTDQRELVVVRAGQRNTNSGPDFLFAQLQLDKMTWAGHVEMHIKSSDWYAHNHHIDKAYDNVILHVVWEEDMPIFTSDDHPLATVVLRDFVDKTLIHRYQELSSSDLWIPCADRIKHIDRFKQMAFFDRLYVERLAQKTKVFQQWLDQTANDWENVLFIALAKGFGLSVEFDILYGKGISKNGELLDLGVEEEIIQKSGSWFSYGDTKLGQGRDSVIKLFEDNLELAEEIEGKIRNTQSEEE